MLMVIMVRTSVRDDDADGGGNSNDDNSIDENGVFDTKG